MASRFPTFRDSLSTSGAFRSWWPCFTTAAQRQSLLRLLAVGAEEHLPLAPLVESWAEDERGVQRRRLRKLARVLREGRPLAEAVELVPGVLSEDDVLAIRFDAQMGTRTAAMRQRLKDQQAAATAGPPRLQRALVYLGILVPVSLLLISFVQLKIVPVINRMLHEFEIEAPPALAWSVATDGGSTLVPWWLAALAIFALLWWLLATRSGRPVRYALFGRLVRPWQEQRAARVLEKMAVAVSAGRPIPGALSTLARYHYDPTIRQELLWVRNEVEQGAGVWQSMAGVGLLTEDEAELLDRATRGGNLAWMLSKLVAAKERRTARRAEWAAELAMPAVVLLMAGVVVFQALTVFQPLTQIINALN